MNEVLLVVLPFVVAWGVGFCVSEALYERRVRAMLRRMREADDLRPGLDGTETR